MNDQELTINLLLGTGREGRVSEHAARFVEAELKKRGVNVVFFDVRDYAIGTTHGPHGPSPAMRPWQEAMAKADGLVIVSPEYNHGYPGELKIMLDALYEEYWRKPVAFCGVSMSGLGGARCVEQLREVTIELRMMPLRHAVYFSNATELFAEDGAIKDAAYVERLQPLFDDLLWYARVLKEARAAA